MRRWLFLILLFILVSTPVLAQEDALNLPTDLYVLADTGRVERYGLGVQTVTPEGETVIDFGVAPDGVWLAYRTGDALKLLDMTTGVARTLEGATAASPPFRGRGQSVSWSPDARALAYTVDYGLRVYFNVEPASFFDVPTTPILDMVWSPDSKYLAAEAENNIWWVYRREGEQMILHAALPTSFGVAWADTNVLMFAPETGGLYLMDVANANAQAQIAEANVFFSSPAARARGEVVVFARPEDDTNITPTAGYLTRVTFAENGTQFESMSDTSVDLNGLRWGPRGTLLVALGSGILALVDPASAQGFALPMTGVVSYSWGGIRPTSTEPVTPTSEAYFLGDDITGARSIWRLPRDGSPAAPITAPEIVVETYTVASDGRTLAYAAEGQVWLQRPDADAPTALIAAANVTGLSFAPGDTTLAYDADGAIFTLDLTTEGAAPTQLLAGYVAPRYSPDGATMLVRLPDGDVGQFTPATGEVLRWGAFDKVIWLADGRPLGIGAPIRDGSSGLYLLDTTGAAPPALLFAANPGMMVVDAVEATVGQARVIVARQNAPGRLQLYDVTVNGGGSTVLIEPGFALNPRLSPDGRYMVGLADGAGTLVVFDLNIGRQVVLSQVRRIDQLRWLF